MKLGDFDFPLPSELVAQQPADRRDASRLLIVPPSGPLEHGAFPDLARYLRDGDVLVLNETRVRPARLILHRQTGGRVDALIVKTSEARRAIALLDTSRRLAVGEQLQVEDHVRAKLVEKAEDGAWVLEFEADIDPLVARLGRPPLPPYIRRDATDQDFERYQTVYAKNEGAIAAPTAGLHFTPQLLDELGKRIEIVRLTLHVGAGTFKPVKVENIDDHRMEPEWYDLGTDSRRTLEGALEKRRRIVAVGTTSCRALETWARTGRDAGWTDLFIRPPFKFKVVGALLTNFHTPKSTLLMLVSAFAGRERILEAYAEAIRLRYRFFSYGDATLLLR